MKCFSVTIKALILFLLIIFFFSCGGKVTTRPPSDDFEFTINGVVVKDMNSGKDIAYFSILRDGDPYAGAVVMVNSDTLENEGNGNYFLEGFPLFNYGQNVSINVSSTADDFDLSTSRQIPGSFEITDINHTTITSALSDDVRVSFSTSSGASGYFYSAVRPDGSDGFTAVIEPARLHTIPASCTIRVGSFTFRVDFPAATFPVQTAPSAPESWRHQHRLKPNRESKLQFASQDRSYSD
jgi:hypothetical protein